MYIVLEKVCHVQPGIILTAFPSICTFPEVHQTTLDKEQNNDPPYLLSTTTP